MRRIQMYIIIDSLAYTFTLMIQALINSVFGDAWSPAFSSVYLLQLFVVCTLISALMYVTDSRLEEHLILHRFVQLAEVFLAVFGVGGGIFRWFLWDADMVLMVSLMLVAIYGATYGVMLLHYTLMSKEINEKLAEERGEKNEKNH